MNSIENASFVSPLANAGLNLPHQQSFGFLERIWSQLNAWTIFFTILALCAAYDQCSYQYQKYGIIGPAWKMPFIGPFLESMRPDFTKYKQKWESGSLSCVSVFHKYVADSLLP